MAIAGNAIAHGMSYGGGRANGKSSGDGGGKSVRRGRPEYHSIDSYNCISDKVAKIYIILFSNQFVKPTHMIMRKPFLAEKLSSSSGKYF